MPRICSVSLVTRGGCMGENRLVGSWRLVSWTNLTASGRRTAPFGDEPNGMITYTSDGFMSATVTHPGRPRFATGDLMAGSTDEKVAAAEGYIGYCGSYELHGDSVVHRVMHSFFPNWEGGEQERIVRLTGERLVLSTRPMLLAGEFQTAVLTWERMPRRD
jgi:Lipocalin-like domain